MTSCIIVLYRLYNMLHLVGPQTAAALSKLLDLQTKDSTILLLGDAIHALLRPQTAAKLRSAIVDGGKCCVLRPHAEARGLSALLDQAICQIDYHNFVELTAQNQQLQSWP